MAQEVERADSEDTPVTEQQSPLLYCSEVENSSEKALEVAQILKEQFAEEVLDIREFRGQIAVIVKAERVKEILHWLKENQGFNHLQDLCGVDYLPERPRFEVVYNLFSIPRRLHIRVRAKIDEEFPEVDSVTDLWEGANWHERECFDMFGIRFRGHPDLRRILMPEDWDGYPLRKDYPLRGRELWRGFREILESKDGEESNA